MNEYPRDAKCREMNPQLFDADYWPKTNHVSAPEQHRELAELCEGCPVARHCAAEALSNPGWSRGVIRAGVKLSPTATRYSDRERERLELVRNGWTPLDAVYLTHHDGPVPLAPTTPDRS